MRSPAWLLLALTVALPFAAADGAFVDHDRLGPGAGLVTNAIIYRAELLANETLAADLTWSDPAAILYLRLVHYGGSNGCAHTSHPSGSPVAHARTATEDGLYGVQVLGDVSVDTPFTVTITIDGGQGARLVEEPSRTKYQVSFDPVCRAVARVNDLLCGCPFD